MPRCHKRAPVAYGSIIVALLFSLVGIPHTSPPALADHTPSPTGVAPGRWLQSEVGCPGRLASECTDTELTYDATDDVWQGCL
ncbi:MAG: hypothetical protein R3E79_36150 [Caldilineaceae bacterium]